MTKSVAILQSNYIPWKGYFDIIRKVDCFIFYDDVKYTKNDWRNRNKIKTPYGARWLTIPCGGNYSILINEVRVDNNPWQEAHYKALADNYADAPYWQQFQPFLQEMYLDTQWQSLSELNQTMITRIAREFLGITTTFERSEAYNLNASKEDRVLQLLGQSGATHYVSGPAAKDYLHQENFDARGITLEYMDYRGYPEYPQFHPPFEHGVTILDLLFHTGSKAVEYMQQKALAG